MKSGLLRFRLENSTLLHCAAFVDVLISNENMTKRRTRIFDGKVWLEILMTALQSFSRQLSVLAYVHLIA